MCRAFSPRTSGGPLTWAFGPGWYVARLWRFYTHAGANLILIQPSLLWRIKTTISGDRRHLIRVQLVGLLDT